MRTNGVFLPALALALCLVPAAWAQDEEAAPAALPDQVPGEVLVKFARRTPPAAVLGAAQAVGAQHLGSFDQLLIRHWRVGGGLTVEKAIEILANRPFVEFAEPNYVYSANDVPDDPRFGELWGLHNTGLTAGTPDADIDAPEAWDIQKGSRSVVVAVIDSGADYVHEDLAMNMWISKGEIPAGIYAQLLDIDGDNAVTFWDLNDPANQGPGKITDLNGNGYIDGGDLHFSVAEGGWYDDLDTDGNGYIDDLLGAGNAHEPRDWNGHGTHVAGTIGAAGNNGAGVAGVNRRVTIMPLKFLSMMGTGTTSQAIFFINYASSFVDGSGNRIVRVMNASWSGGDSSESLKAAIASSGALFVAAAGNGGSQPGKQKKQYPAAFDLASVVSVAATDRNDLLASFSSWDSSWVDLGAPGVDVLSTVPTYGVLYVPASGGTYYLTDWDPSGYKSLSGTSMAAPHVAGVAALVMAQDPTLDILAVKDRILAAVDPLPSLAGKTLTGGRLNAFAALPPPPGPGVIVSPTQGLVTTEAGGTATFSVVLKTQPAADVSMGLSSGDTAEGTVSPASLTFTPASWSVPQTVTVTGVDDVLVDGDVAYTILTAPAASADPDYSGLDAADVSVTNADDDSAGVTVNGISPNSMSAGGTIAVTVFGSGFAAGATVTFEAGSGPAPLASNVAVVNSGTITATVTVGGTGPKGSRVWDVRVTNPGGSSGVLLDGFAVIK